MSAVIENNKIKIIDPITKESIGQIEMCDKTNFSNVEKKSIEYNDWKLLSLKKRCYYINKFRRKILKNKDLIQQIIISETCKKDFDLFTELFTVLEHLKETKSELSNRIINNYDMEIKNFVQVCPKEMINKLEYPITLKSKIKKVS